MGFGNMLSKELANQKDIIVVSLCLTNEATADLKELGIHGIQCDVTSDEDVDKAKEYIDSLLKEKNAVLHTLVNNAGRADPGDFLFFSDLSQMQNVMDVNYYGQLRVTKALLPLFLQTSHVFGGRIINMSSVCGASASAGNSAYNASKFAVEAWSDCLRIELSNFNIKVVKVRPGQFATTIQSEFGENWAKNYESAPGNIKQLYGGQAHSKKLSEAFKGMDSFHADPMDAVDALVDMIGMNQNDLRAAFWLGNDANTMWSALASLPTHIADSFKSLISIHPSPRLLPPTNVISHVTIRVSDIEKSLPFYEAFGFKKYGQCLDGQQFLKLVSSKIKWNTLVLLKEDKALKPRGKSYEAGMPRLCIYTTNLNEEVKRLKSLGLEPMAPTAVDKSAGVVLNAHLTAFKDPDGFVVYIIEFTKAVGMVLRMISWWKKQSSPSMFHWTINVTSSIKSVMAGFEKLGFKTMSDQDSSQVANDLLPAFNIDPNTTELEHIRICHLPNDSFHATLMQWNTPKTEMKGSELTNSMTMSVDDVEHVVEIAKDAGFKTKSPEFHELPVFGRVLVGTIYVEPQSAPIEVISFSQCH